MPRSTTARKPRTAAARPADGAFVGGTPADARFTLTAPVATDRVTAAAGEDAPPAVVTGRRFSFVAYSGGRMRPQYWGDDLVLDLAGITLPGQVLPVLLDHMPYTDCVVGQTDQVGVSAAGITAAGDLIAVGDEAVGAVRLADAGFKFQASVGGRVMAREYVEAGAVATCNGQTFPGPIVIARQTELREISVVVIGADANTSFLIDEDDTVNPTTAAATTPPTTPPANAGGTTVALTASGAPTPTPAPPVVVPPGMPSVDEIRAGAAAELRRQAAIEAVTRGHLTLRATAVEQNWTAERAELEVLRASRAPAGAGVQSQGGGVFTPANRMSDHRVFEAALCLRAGVRPQLLEQDYGRDRLDAAHSRDVLASASLSYLLAATIQAAGGQPRYGSVTDDTIRAAFRADRELQASGAVTTYSLSGILSNVANKSLLSSFTAIDPSALAFVAQSDVNDFKQVSRYRLTATGRFEKVGPDGEIKHGGMAEETFKNQASTYAKMLAITRQDFINDDLGALTRLVSLLGRNGAITLHYELFKLWLSNPSNFFAAGNKNLNTGAGSALSIGAITAAVKAFREQVDVGGIPIMVAPKYLLVPPALETYAGQLFKDMNVNETTTTDKPKPTSNPHAGRFMPLTSPFLGTAGGLTGGSETKWWLVADPADVAAAEVVYLRGQRAPVVESSEADFDTLGMKMRGYFDFGVGMQDPKAAQQNNGV